MPANQIDAFMSAISAQESGGNYQARNSRTGAYGRFQIMPSNWAPWSRETFGRVVPRTAANQDRVAKHKMMQYYRSYGSWDLVAAAWFGGPGAANALRRGDRSVLSRSDGNMTIGQYIAKMKRGLNSAIRKSPKAWDPSNNRTSPSASLPAGPTNYGTDFANYDAAFGGVGKIDPARLLGGLEDEDELTDDQIGPAIIAAFEAMGNAMSPDGRTVDVDELTSIFDQDVDEDDPNFDIDDYFNPNQTNLMEDAIGTIEDQGQSIDEQATGEQQEEEGPEWWNPADPLSTPVDPSSSSTTMAFQELGQAEALSLIGDLGIPSSAKPDFIPAKEISAKQLRKQGGATSAGMKAVEIAKKYLGIPYLWGGTDPRRGLDCSGLLQLVYRQMGVNLPRVSRDQARQGKRISSMKNARPGDLLAFSSARVGGAIGHIGIYVGNGMMLHAPRTGRNVEITRLSRTPTTIRRVL